MTPDEVERVARAIRDGLAKWDFDDKSPPLAWDAMAKETPEVAEMYRVMARSAIEAIAAATQRAKTAKPVECGASQSGGGQPHRPKPVSSQKAG
jgi:hypothetical protein